MTASNINVKGKNLVTLQVIQCEFWIKKKSLTAPTTYKNFDKAIIPYLRKCVEITQCSSTGKYVLKFHVLKNIWFCFLSYKEGPVVL